MSRFLDALRSGRVLLMDGAMGTELRRAGLRDGECGELWNTTHPERVRAIHLAYLAGGAEVLLTNTFQLHAVTIERHNLSAMASVEGLWFRASAHADYAACDPLRSAAGGRAATFVLADIGPMMNPATDEESADLSGLRRARPIDGVLLETFSTPAARHVARRAREFGPVCLALTYRKDPERGLVTLSGHTPEWFAQRARKDGVAALGVNCGPEIMVRDCAEIVRRYRSATDLPLFARPNAGTPTRVGDRWVYPRSPAEMAAELPELLEAGVSMVGGCCGTTPEHIAAFRPVMDAWNARRK